MYAMARGKKKEEGLFQLQKENRVGRQRINAIGKAFRAIEVDREERNNGEPEMVDFIKDEEKDTL